MQTDESRRVRVLYVDGDADARRAVRECLDGEGMSVRTAGDREGALETLRTERVDCVVSEPDSELVVEGNIETVVGDETRLRRLFENLFRNAVEHGSTSPRSQAPEDALEHAGPGVTVRVGPLAEGRGFYVADDGPGIPEDERESVFDRGYTTADDGTGFGLSIVAEIVSAHGGEITVTESESGGARFEITGIDVR